jgi:hypothetical protein
VTSVSAVNYRLHELGLVSDWHYRRLCIEMSKRGFRSSEPDGAPRETSLVLPKLLTSLLQEDGVSRSGIAAALGVSLRELESLLFAFVLTAIDGGRKAGTNAIASASGPRRVK